MKIVIMGYSGSGKSTLARKLSELYNIEALHLDKVQFLPNWVERSREEKKQIVCQFLDSHENWIIDGNYNNLYRERRLEEADLIILLLFHRINCLYRVWKRYNKYRNQTRPDMGEGCNEKLDWPFVKWVLFEGRSRKIVKSNRQVQETYPNKTVVLYNQRQLDLWMKECQQKTENKAS